MEGAPSALVRRAKVADRLALAARPAQKEESVLVRRAREAEAKAKQVQISNEPPKGKEEPKGKGKKRSISRGQPRVPVLVFDPEEPRTHCSIALSWRLAEVRHPNLFTFRLKRRVMTHETKPDLEFETVVEETDERAYKDEGLNEATGYEYQIFGWAEGQERWQEMGRAEMHTWKKPDPIEVPMVDYQSGENVYKRALQSLRVDRWYTDEYEEAKKTNLDQFKKFDDHPPVNLLMLGDKGCGKSAFINTVWSAIVDHEMREGPAIIQSLEAGAATEKKAQKKKKKRAELVKTKVSKCSVCMLHACTRMCRCDVCDHGCALRNPPTQSNP